MTSSPTRMVDGPALTLKNTANPDGSILKGRLRSPTTDGNLSLALPELGPSKIHELRCCARH